LVKATEKWSTPPRRARSAGGMRFESRLGTPTIEARSGSRELEGK
jgi:hypothetical protein